MIAVLALDAGVGAGDETRRGGVERGSVVPVSVEFAESLEISAAACATLGIAPEPELLVARSGSSKRRSSCICSLAPEKRSAGSRAHARANHASNPGGTTPICDGIGKGREQISSTRLPIASLSKGRRPKMHSYA